MLLAIVAVTLAFVDLRMGLNEWQLAVDNIVLIIFIIDYLVRFVIAKDKKLFLKKNILELISIIPLSSMFRVFRIARLAKVVRIAKVVKFARLAVFFARLLRKCNRFLNTNGFKYMLSLSAIMVVIGGLLICYTENISFQDGLWWAFVTATTVGYGDLSPSTAIGRIIAVILMILGIGLIGSLTSTITNYFLNKSPKKSIQEDILESIKSRLDDISSLSDDDVDDICKILKTLNKK